jgi:hypothetical protein
MVKIRPGLIVILGFLLLGNSFASAVVVNSVEAGDFAPGKEGAINIFIKNTFNGNVKDLSLSLDFTGLPFVPIGSSAYSIDELRENKEEQFVFRVKPSYNIKPGDYEVPYEITYIFDDNLTTKKGSVGISVKANPEFSFSVTTENPLIGSQGKVTLKIVNNGLADARFVSIKILSSGYTLLSGEDFYVGTINSDDFETVSFDAVFKSNSPRLNAVLTYKNLDNQDITRSIDLPIEVYTREEALQLGIIQKSYTSYYIFGAITIVILWFIWRSIRKRMKAKARLRADSK